MNLNVQVLENPLLSTWLSDIFKSQTKWVEGSSDSKPQSYRDRYLSAELSIEQLAQAHPLSTELSVQQLVQAHSLSTELSSQQLA